MSKKGCARPYLRYNIHMNEEWKPIKGFEKWQISNHGRVKSPNKILKPFFDQRKYYMVDLGKTKRVHRLVAEHFIPNPQNKPQVNHKDGNKLNNHIDNLEWVTNQENMTHACKKGLYDKNKAKGEINGNSKLKIETVKEIKRLLKEGKISQRQISIRIGVSPGAINQIKQGKTWAHVE